MQPVTTPLQVTLPDGTIAKSTHTGRLNLPNLPLQAQIVHIYPSWIGSLLSVGLLCDAGLTATYTATDFTLSDNDNHIVLRGRRSLTTRLWTLDLPAIVPLETASVVVTEPTGPQADCVRFYHGAMCSPANSTMLKAIDLNYIQFPGLTPAVFAKHGPNSIATAKGHMDQDRSGHRSTQPSPEPDTDVEDETAEEQYPIPTSRPSTRIVVYTKLERVDRKRATDVTGKFPHASALGNQYVMVMKCGNYIHFELLKTRNGPEFVSAYAAGTDFFVRHGFLPTFEQADNECSKILTKYCATRSPTVTITFVPPDIHRANPAERSIRTAKNHITAALCNVDPNFPIEAWDCILEQAELTLNLMRSSAFTPNCSAWQAVRGPYIFAATPIAVPGTRVLAFNGPDKRASWAAHGIEGFYVGPALDHYRCYTVYIPSTRRTRIVSQLSWHPAAHMAMPGVSPLSQVTYSIDQLEEAIRLATTSRPEIFASDQPLAGQRSAISDALDGLMRTIGRAQYRAPEPVEPQRVFPSPSSAPRPSLSTTSTPPDPVSEDPVAPPRVPVDVPAPTPPSPQPTRAPVLASPAPTAPSPPVLSPAPAATRHSPRAPVPNERYANAVTAPGPAAQDLERRRNRQMRYKQRRRDAAKARTVALDQPIPEATLTATRAELALNWTPLRIGRARRRLRINIAAIEKHYAASVQQMDAFAMDANNKPLTYKTALRGPDADAWRQAEHEEFVRLIDGTKTMHFIDFRTKPRDRVCSYYNPQVKLKIKLGRKVFRVRGTYGGNITDFEGLRSSGTADLQTVKLLLNAAVSEDAHIATGDAHDFYLATKLERPEYMWVTRAQLPTATIERYGHEIVWQNDRTMVQCDNGIYGLPQAGKLAHDLAVEQLAAAGYHQCPNTPCLFRHETRNIYFTLVVDDFLIKYTDKADVEHLCEALRGTWDFEMDWSASSYLGMRIDYNREARCIGLSMPGYVEAALKRFNVLRASKPTHSPLICEPIRYGAHVESVSEDNSPALAPDQIKFIQEVIGVFLYYARTVDPTMLAPLNKLASRQARPTEQLLREVHHFLQYAATWPSAELVFVPSDMRLAIWSDASYLSESDSRSRAGGHHSLTTAGDFTKAPLNGAIEVISTILPMVVAAASEAEVGALFLNSQAASPTRGTLLDLGYPQAATPIITDNTTAAGFANCSIRLKRSKAMDMRFNWLKDRTRNGEYTVTWAPGLDNLADYFTKAHPAYVYKRSRHHYVRDPP